MLILNPIGEHAGRYYLDGPDGRWCGAGRHDLGLDGAVAPDALDAVLRGRRPADGMFLAERRAPHRRAGWDLIFTAPKSMSLLAALGSEEAGTVIAGAHRRACADAFVWLEQHGCWARRQGALVPTSGFVAARYGHEVNAAGEPHLHTHVLVANVVHAGDGRWSAIDGSGLWLNRRAVAAVYHLALRQQLLAAGLRPNWEMRPDGAADIADVPRHAIEATSSRRRQIHERLSGDDDPAPLTRTAAQRLSRGQPVAAGSWAARSSHAGFGPERARQVLDDAARRAAAPRPGGGEQAQAGRRLAEDVTVWLAARRSTFSVVDVLQAVAALHVEGTTAAEAYGWARAFVDASPPSADGRRTTPLAAARDDALVRAASVRIGRGAGLVVETGGPVQERGERAAAVRHLTGGGNGVDVLGPPRPVPGEGGWRIMGEKGGFVAQAEVLDAARVVWQRAGHTVAVTTPSAGAARRWRALAGLDRHLPGAAPPSVLIVDRADRRPTAELAGLLDEAERHGSKVVLVEGGTLPARRVALSQGLGRLGTEVGRILPGTALADPPGPLNPVTAGRLQVVPLGRQAFEQVVTTWSELRREGVEAQMVGLGPAECDELNRRARAVQRDNGAVTGDEVVIAGRPFAVGDAVMATRRGVIPAGGRGQVSEVDPDGSMLVQWSGSSTRVDAWNGRHLRHAYATTPGMLHFDDEPVVALGEPADLGPHRDRVVAACLVAAAGPRPEGLRYPPWAVSTEVGTLPVERRVAELEGRRHQLTRELDASRPREPAGDRLALEDDRAWLQSIGRDPRRDPGWRQREAQVEGAERRLAAWTEASRGEVKEWVSLSDAIETRRAALVRVAETDEVAPSRTPELGPVPADATARKTWRQRAGRTLAAADRELVPADRSLTDRSLTHAPLRPGRQLDHHPGLGL